LIPDFAHYFRGPLHDRRPALIRLALDEDGPDCTSDGIFTPTDRMKAVIVAKQDTVIAGLPVIPLILDACAALRPETDRAHTWEALAAEGSAARAGDAIARLSGAARHLLRAERIILNILSRLCGIASLTSRYARELEGTGARLLDTRKTQPGMRGLDKYAVAVGGGVNHRLSLADMLMIKDNHIDAAGSITGAVARLRAGSPRLPLEVECRTPDDVAEAAACKADRIMLDNMDAALLAASLPLIPPDIEAEISGNVTLENIRLLALIGPRHPDFISVGRITHSASAADLSMRLAPEPFTPEDG
jgi:nicotinate-nucleotide pyrophosphorylase (carboxylating)